MSQDAAVVQVRNAAIIGGIVGLYFSSVRLLKSSFPVSDSGMSRFTNASEIDKEVTRAL